MQPSDFSFLNVGCNINEGFGKGWLNVGLYFDSDIVPYGQLKVVNEAWMWHYDITKKLNIKENSFKVIYASHFIEHISFKEASLFLNNMYKILEMEGTIRITFPDLELWIKNYYENNKAFFEAYKEKLIECDGIYWNKVDYRNIKTKGEIFMAQIHNWGHKWGYDFDSIAHLLSDAGFVSIFKKKYLDSTIKYINLLEPSNKIRRLETAYVEAFKNRDVDSMFSQ